MKNRKRRTNQEFIQECSTIHNNFYDYSRTLYIKMHDKVKIICPIHGEFEQEPNSHISGKGCASCAGIKNNLWKKGTTESFIRKSKNIHKNKFSYNNTIYGNNAFEEIVVTCNKHGDFNIKPNTHLSKRNKGGCPLCAKESVGWNRRTWRRACEGKEGILYIIKCSNNKELFYKIGITSRKLEQRFCNKKTMPYNYKIIKLIKSKDSDYIFNLERKLHKINKKYKYIPKIQFDGFTECFSKVDNYD